MSRDCDDSTARRNGTGRRFRVSKGGMKADINVTPYIDILLVLLIVFMVIQPMRQYDLKTRVPQLRQEVAEPSSPPILVSMDERLTLRVNGEVVQSRDLGGLLFEMLSRRSDRRLFVRAASDAAFGHVVAVIDVAKGAGAGDIGLLQE